MGIRASDLWNGLCLVSDMNVRGRSQCGLTSRKGGKLVSLCLPRSRLGTASGLEDPRPYLSFGKGVLLDMVRTRRRSGLGRLVRVERTMSKVRIRSAKK